MAGFFWIIGQPENASQRGELMQSALDSCAGLIKLVAVLHFNDRDAELAELVGDECVEGLQSPHGKPADTTVAKIKGNFTKGEGIGKTLILRITQARRLHAKPDEPDAAKSSAGLLAIREAVATLMASGSGGRLVKRRERVPESGEFGARKCVACEAMAPRSQRQNQ